MPPHDHPHEDCLALFEKLSEYLDGELDETSRREIEGHAQACIKCNVCVETLKRTIDLCATLKAPKIPAEVSRRIDATIQDLIDKST